MLTSRGCPFHCSYCATSKLFGYKWRERTPENILNEINQCIKKYGIKKFEFVDDLFTFNLQRAEKICQKIIEKNLDISWGATTRADTITAKLAQKMKNSGCHTVWLGIESNYQKQLDFIDKKISIKQIKNAVKNLKKAGIQVLGSFMLGFPSDTKEKIKKRVKFAKELDIDYAEFSILTPYPGTLLFNFAKENKKLTTKDWSDFTTMNPVMEIENLKKEELEKLLKKAYLKFYLRPKAIWILIKNNQFKQIKTAAKKAFNYWKETKFG